jgi:hypothetical protein
MAEVELTRYEAEQGELPAVCVKCGEPMLLQKRKTFTWSPPWLIMLLFFGLPLFFLVASFVTHRMKVKLPYCEKHVRAAARRGWLVLGGIFGVLLLIVTSALAIAPESPLHPLLGYVCGATVVLGIVWFILLAVSDYGAVSAKEVQSKTILLKGVCPEFVKAVEDFRWQHPELALEDAKEPWWPRLIIPAMFLGMVGFVIFIGITSTLLDNLKNPRRARPGQTTALQGPQEVRDDKYHFRLRLPGPDWELLGPQKDWQAGPFAAAGANHKDGYDGIVIVNDAENGSIAGKEELLAVFRATALRLKNQTKVEVEKLKVEGLPAVRYRVVGTDEKGVRSRVEETFFIREGIEYRLIITGKESSTQADGSSFRPFTDAFELLPSGRP